MTARLSLLLVVQACSPALLRVESSAPNAAVYLTHESGDGDRPGSFLARGEVPFTFSLRHPERGPYFLWVSAPFHTPEVVPIQVLRRRKTTTMVVDLAATEDQRFLK